MCGV